MSTNVAKAVLWNNRPLPSPLPEQTSQIAFWVVAVLSSLFHDREHGCLHAVELLTPQEGLPSQPVLPQQGHPS